MCIVCTNLVQLYVFSRAAPSVVQILDIYGTIITCAIMCSDTKEYPLKLLGYTNAKYPPRMFIHNNTLGYMAVFSLKLSLHPLRTIYFTVTKNNCGKHKNVRVFVYSCMYSLRDRLPSYNI